MDSPASDPRERPQAVLPDAAAPLSAEERRTLHELALESIRWGLEGGCPLAVDPDGHTESLRAPGAAFVTLRIGGTLRGCVGSLEPRRSLVEDVAHNAFGAAFRDSRFPPLAARELPVLELHISRLTPLVPFPAASREALLAALRPGVDGLVVEDMAHRATFLPQVWEALPDPETFLGELFRKAGLAPRHWSATLRCFTYGVEEI